MEYEKIMTAIGDFFVWLGMVLLIIWNYICVFFSTVGKFIADVFRDWIGVMPPVSKFLGIKKLSLTLMIIILLYIITINIYAYVLYAKDKAKAKKKKDRISEFRLLKVAFLGGALGSFIGMRLHRHKTLKKKFTVTVTVLLIIQALLCSMVIGFFGFWIYLS